MIPSSSRVFNISELTDLVFRFVDISDCARMCSVSRATFHAASPIVWEHVEGVHNLLRLFPKSHIAELDCSKDIPRIFQFTLYEPEGQILHTGRFNVYAPFVRSLDIYGKTAIRLDIRGWSYLMRLSNRQTLLPNLISLAVTASYEHDWDPVLWVRLFGSGSLVNVLSTPAPFEYPMEITYPVATAILKWLVEHCPHLQSTCLFPNRDTSHAEIYDAEGDRLTALLHDRPFHHYLLPTLGIRQFSCSLSVLENDSLKALSKLPNLERLTVHAVDEIVDSEHPPLSEDSFPSLRFLSLRCIYCWGLTWVLGIRSLLARLTTLEVYSDICSNDDATSWMIDHFLPALAYGTALEDLTVNFDSGPLHNPSNCVLDLDDDVFDDEDPDSIIALGAFRELPLRKLSISCTNFRIEPSLMDLGSIWPRVTRLELKDLRAACWVLPAFARLPRLEHLVLRLSIHMSFQEENDLKPPLGMNLHTLEGSIGSEIPCKMSDVDKIVRFLLSLWPNLQRIIWPSEGSNERERVLIASLNRGLVAHGGGLIGSGLDV